MFDPRLRYFTATLSPAAIAANTSAEQTFTVVGVDVNDILVGYQKPTAQAGLAIFGGRVSAVDQVGLTFGNFTASSITPTASQVYSFVVVRNQP